MQQEVVSIEIKAIQYYFNLSLFPVSKVVLITLGKSLGAQYFQGSTCLHRLQIYYFVATHSKEHTSEPVAELTEPTKAVTLVDVRNGTNYLNATECWL